MPRKGALLPVVLSATLCMGETIQVPYDYTTVQAAIDAAVEGDTVVVAPGEYAITEPITFRGKGITVRGEGGPEATRIRMADIPAEPQRASVVIFENGETKASLLEGVTLTGGTGTGGDWNDGGGVFCAGSSPTLIECTIAENSALVFGAGGGVWCYDSSPTLINCTISGNTAQGGGGIATFGESAPVLTNCTISENWVWDHGGGVWCCASAMTLIDCTISGNHGWPGGGVSCFRSSSLTLVNCAIAGNSTYCHDVVGGGGVCCYESSPMFINCTITENRTEEDDFFGAGGIACLDASPTLSNCTITRNTVSEISSGAGGVYCAGDSCPALTNCIVWENGGRSLAGLPQVRYSCIEGAEVFPGEGNINADPLFVGDGDIRLQRGSPCIDAGTFEGAPTADIAGNARPCGLAVDMGAFEYCPAIRLALSHALVAECAPARVFVNLTTGHPVQAFSFGVAHDSAVVTLTAIDIVNCPAVQALNGGEGPDYFGVCLSAGTGDCPPDIPAGGTVYCLGAQTQSSTMTIPPGADQPITRLTYAAVPGNGNGTESTLAIVGCLGDHVPVEVIVAINDVPRIPDAAGGLLTVEAPECRFIRGDANGDRRLDIADVMSVLIYLFDGRRGPLRCQDAGDANDDGRLNIADPVRILARLFLDGAPLDPPYPACGPDPTLDRLECGVSTCQ